MADEERMADVDVEKLATEEPFLKCNSDWTATVEPNGYPKVSVVEADDDEILCKSQGEGYSINFDLREDCNVKQSSGNVFSFTIEAWYHWESNIHPRRIPMKCVYHAFNVTGTPKECCSGENCTRYRGTLSKTISGKTCQRWDSQSPHTHPYNPDDYQRRGLDGNYCRNPGLKYYTVWCYTTEDNKRWERCEPCKCTGYTGFKNTTFSGRHCQAWNSHIPHKHYKFTPEKYPDAGLDRNYCRNPSRHYTAWCYTLDMDKKWENCFADEVCHLSVETSTQIMGEMECADPTLAAHYCLNGGTCFEYENGLAEHCHCTAEWTGRRCMDRFIKSCPGLAGSCLTGKY